jgi:CheY-like chemotaxis protein
MVFGDEELAELRVQLIEGGHEPSNPRDARRAHGVAETRPSGSSLPRRDEFLHILGHELRNPLAPVRQAVELLEAHASGEDPDYLREVRKVLARQVTQLTRLVDVLLDADPGPHARAGEAPADDGSEPAEAANMGLALVRRVVELHGGRITAQDQAPGRGTELSVWLPIAAPVEQPVGPGSSSPVAPQPATPRHVLVVDDNEDAAEMLALVLRKHGHTVELAFNGEDALELAAVSHPEVVLLDIGLPGIDGYEVARRLRASASAVRPVLVAVSGYGQEADRKCSIKAGFDHHLVKPVAMEKLLPLLVADEEK